MTLFTKAFCVATLFTGFAWANEELKVGSSITTSCRYFKIYKTSTSKTRL